MVAFGEWETFTGIRESFGTAENGFPHVGDAGPTFGDAFGETRTWVATQSFQAYNDGHYPHTFSSAHLCALSHASEAEDGGDSWSPGVCAALSSPTPGTNLVSKQAIRVGVSSSWRIPGTGFLVPSTYRVAVRHARVRLGWIPLWMALSLPPWGDYREVHPQVLVQVPGFYDALNAGLTPDVEILRVDGEASISTVGSDQSQLAVPTTIRMHNRGSGLNPTPYSALGGVVGSASTGGDTSAISTITDLQLGDTHIWDLSSAFVAAGSDPGEFQSNIAQVQFVTDFIWDIRVRFRIPEVIDVCRWLQRDDGLGVTGAGRARTGTSLQRGNRHRGYR